MAKIGKTSCGIHLAKFVRSSYLGNMEFPNRFQSQMYSETRSGMGSQSGLRAQDSELFPSLFFFDFAAFSNFSFLHNNPSPVASSQGWPSFCSNLSSIGSGLCIYIGWGLLFIRDYRGLCL